MTNTNCLKGIQCPACGQEDRFKIAALIACLVTDNGSEPVGDHEWNDESSNHCPQCGFDAKLKDFTKRNRLPPDSDNAEKTVEDGRVTDTDMQTPLLVANGTPLQPGKMYLRLYHGRSNPAQDMDDWGFVGPTFGPLSCYVHTYCSTFRIHSEFDTSEVWLETHDDMIRWGGSFYGDLQVFIAGNDDRG